MQPSDSILEDSFEALPSSRKSNRPSKAQTDYYKTLAAVAVGVVLTSVVIIEVVQRIGGTGTPSEISLTTSESTDSDSAELSSLAEAPGNVQSSLEVGRNQPANRSALNEGRLKKAYAALPVSGADMRQRYDMHGDPEANKKWYALHTKLADTVFDQAIKTLPSRVEELTPSSTNQIRVVLRRYAGVSPLVREAIAYDGKIRFDLRTQDGNRRLSHAHWLTMRYLELTAFARLPAGNVDKCRESLILMMAAQDKFKRLPSALHQVFRLVWYRHCRDLFAALLARSDFTKAELTEWREFFQHPSPRNGVRHALFGEYALMLYGFDHPDDIGLPQQYRDALRLLGPERKADRELSQELMARSVYALDLPVAEARQEYKAIDAELVAKGNKVKQFWYVMTFYNMPAVEQTYEALLGTELALDQVDLAIAIELFRKDNSGRLPNPLRLLVPTYIDQLPVDPLRGEAIKMAIEGDSYYLYTSGGEVSEPNESTEPIEGKFGKRINEMWVERN